MKQIIRKSLAWLGYKIERVDNPNPLESKYHRLLQEIYGCYKDLKFTALSNIDNRNVELMANLDGTQISEAIYIINALQQVYKVEGDVCEFGVAQGYTSALIAYNIQPTLKVLWLFDSFAGLPAPTSKDKLKDDIYNLKSIEAYEGTMKHGQEIVLNNLMKVAFGRQRTRIIDGFIEKTILASELPKSVSFAYVDFDFYSPIKTALNFLHEVLVKDGVVIVDDYDFFSEGAKTAVDEFFNENKSTYSLELPIPSAGKFAVLTKKR